jgi:hypothetical protein
MRTPLVLLSVAAAMVGSGLLTLHFFGGPRTPDGSTTPAAETRLAAIESRLAELQAVLVPPPKPTSGGLPKQATLSEVIQLLSELQGMVLDSERSLRRDLVGIFEKLSSKIDNLPASGGGAPADTAAAKAALREELRKEGILIHEDRGMVEVVDGEMSETNRAIEFLAVAEGGRAYESLILLKVRPMALKLALEDLGLAESEPDPEAWTWGESASGAYVYVVWDGQKKPMRAEDLILDRSQDETMARTKWVFTASRWFTDDRTWERHFAADLYKNLAAISFKYSLDSLLACPLPGAADENNWFVHPNIAPKPGTKVRVFFRKEPDPGWDKF